MTKDKSLFMTQGPLAKNILKFSIPLVFSQVLQVLFNMADVAVVGKCAGPIPLGAVGSTSMLTHLFVGFLVGIGSGINVIVAQYLGAKKDGEVKKSVNTSLIISICMGLLLLGVCLVFARPFLLLLKTKDTLIDKAVLYLKIYALGMPALGIFNFGNGVLSAGGDTKRPLIYLSVSGIINVGLNFFFVLCFDMDVDGVALASVISEYVSAVLVLIRLLRIKSPCALSFKNFKFSFSKAKQILGLGVSAGCQFAIFSIANLFIQSAVNSFSDTVVAGNSAASNADSIIYNVMAAFYSACSAFIGQNYGARQKDRILKTFYICVAYSFLSAFILGAYVYFFGETFLYLFTDDANVVAAGMDKLKIMAFSYCVSAFMDCTISASRGLGKSLVPTVAVIIGSCIFRIIWIYTVFAHYQTIPSLYLLYVFSWTITAIFEIAYFSHVYKKCDFEKVKL